MRQEARAALAMRPRILVNAPQHASRHRDVYLLGRPEVTLDRDIDHAPNPALVFAIVLVLCHGLQCGQVAPALGQQFAVQLDGFRRIVKRLLNAVAGGKAPREIRHSNAVRAALGSGLDGDDELYWLLPWLNAGVFTLR